MSNRERLKEQYEEALFELLMDGIAEQEGKMLLLELERVNNDPSFEVPEMLDRKCKKIIKNVYRKDKTRKVGRVTSRVIQRVAVAILIAVMVMAVAYATIPEVRVKVLNILLTVTDVSTDITIGSSQEPAGKASDELARWVVSKIPDGYQLLISDENDWSRFYHYENGSGGIIQIDLTKVSEGVNAGVDTENADRVSEVIVNGSQGLCVEKEGAIHVVWVDTSTQVIIAIYCKSTTFETAMEIATGIVLME